MGLQAISNEGGRRYVTVIGGELREKVEEGTDGAKKREYEKHDGSTGVKWELSYGGLEGLIESIEFDDTDFGKVMIIGIDGIALSVGTESNYFGSLARRLPNIDLASPVHLKPYAFTPKGEEREKRGFSVQQRGEKLKDFFYDGKKNLHGMPEAKDCNDSDDWKVYFLSVKKFLIKYIEENIIPKLPEANSVAIATDFDDLKMKPKKKDTESILEEAQKAADSKVNNTSTDDLPF
jgi:hypothetical protein